MTRSRVRYAAKAEADLLRLFDFLAERDLDAADRAIDAIEESMSLMELSPFSCRKVELGNPFLRELVIPFGRAGYIALFEVEPPDVVTIAALRHQREDDYLG